MEGKGSPIYLIPKIFDLYITLTTTFFNLYFTCTIKYLIRNVNSINKLSIDNSRPKVHKPEAGAVYGRKLINGR